MDWKRFFLFILAGILQSIAELCVLCANSIYEFCSETMLLSCMAALWFWAVSRRKTRAPFYMARIVGNMWIGRVMLYSIEAFRGNEEALAIVVFWAVMLTVLLCCMRIVQMVYDRTQEREVYFGYPLLGAALALNVTYAVASIPNISWKSVSWRNFDTMQPYFAEHISVLLLTALAVIYKYQKVNRNRVIGRGISKRRYLLNALKMTLLSFCLLAYPMYIIFLAS